MLLYHQRQPDLFCFCLEANENVCLSFSVLFSSTVLQAIRMLIIASTDLQKEIVEGGRVSHWSNVEKLAGFLLFKINFFSKIDNRQD